MQIKMETQTKINTGIIFLIICLLIIPFGIQTATAKQNNNLCNLNENICEKVCGGQFIKQCTTDVPPSVCVEFCRLD